VNPGVNGRVSSVKHKNLAVGDMLSFLSLQLRKPYESGLIPVRNLTIGSSNIHEMICVYRWCLEHAMFIV